MAKKKPKKKPVPPKTIAPAVVPPGPRDLVLTKGEHAGKPVELKRFLKSEDVVVCLLESGEEIRVPKAFCDNLPPQPE